MAENIIHSPPRDLISLITLTPVSRILRPHRSPAIRQPQIRFWPLRRGPHQPHVTRHSQRMAPASPPPPRITHPPRRRRSHGHRLAGHSHSRRLHRPQTTTHTRPLLPRRRLQHVSQLKSARRPNRTVQLRKDAPTPPPLHPRVPTTPPQDEDLHTKTRLEVRLPAPTPPRHLLRPTPLPTRLSRHHVPRNGLTPPLRRQALRLRMELHIRNRRRPHRQSPPVRGVGPHNLTLPSPRRDSPPHLSPGRHPLPHRATPFRRSPPQRQRLRRRLHRRYAHHRPRPPWLPRSPQRCRPARSPHLFPTTIHQRPPSTRPNARTQ